MKGNMYILRFVATVCGFIFVLAAQAQISGAVFRDFNGNGQRDNSSSFSEPFVAGVTVKAFDAVGAEVGSTTTNVSGAYSFVGLPLPLRIEFSNIPDGDFTGPQGSGSGTSVQFYSASTSAANFGINYPNDYCQANPQLVVSCYVNGDNNNTPPLDVIVAYNYSATGTSDASKRTLANKNQIGAVWGMAYSRQRERIYAASVLKRQVGLGSGGLGGIYVIDPTQASPNGVLFATVPNVGTIGSNTARGLGAPNGLSRDADAFGKVGRTGLGDIEISPDERYLYVVNLNDRNIYIIDIENPGNAPVAVAVPDPGCNNGEYRPYGLKVRRGKLYVGVVCDASSGTRADLSATVLTMDLATNAFDPGNVLQFPLNYRRNPAWNESFYSGANVIAGGESFPVHTTRWYPWRFTYDPLVYNRGDNSSRYTFCHPIPVLSDLEFDQEGNMILGFADLTANQFFSENQLPFANGADRLVTIVSGGDILRAQPLIGGGFAIESLSNTMAMEFFTGEFFSNQHGETAQGGLALLAGRREVVTIAMDPFAVNTGGTIKLSTTSGAQNGQGFQVFSGTSGLERKGIGLGDLETLCSPAPLEIGNRVWNDQNNNGIQDAGEPGIQGVAVTLWKDDGMGNFTEIASATTDANGHYYFSSATGTSTASVIYNVTQLLPNMGYELRFPTSSGGLNLTIPNNGGMDANADARDSDANPAGVISFMTGRAGANNHSFDVGYGCPPSVCRPTTVVKN